MTQIFAMSKFGSGTLKGDYLIDDIRFGSCDSPDG